MSSVPDQAATARLMQTLSLGVYVIGVADGQRYNAFTASSVMTVSLDPVMLVVSVGTRHFSHGLICRGPRFTVNVLRADQLELARHFGTQSGRDVDKLPGVQWRACSGAPVLEEALAYFECERAGTMPAGDHELVIGRVCAGELLLPKSSPLAYSATKNMDGAAERYGPIGRPSTPR